MLTGLNSPCADKTKQKKMMRTVMSAAQTNRSSPVSSFILSGFWAFNWTDVALSCSVFLDLHNSSFFFQPFVSCYLQRRQRLCFKCVWRETTRFRVVVCKCLEQPLEFPMIVSASEALDECLVKRAIQGRKDEACLKAGNGGGRELT